ERLHRVLQDAMGWEDCHLHSFTVRGVEYGVREPAGFGLGFDDDRVEPEKRHTIDRLVRAKDRFTYVYDFGDGWTHDILVEKVSPGELAAPRCVAGARACPPEDCGGVWGYADLVLALADKTHERHEALAEWVPEGWSAERFDLEAADRLVARHRPVPGRSRGASTSRGRARARA
ncbi:MAG: plasmid pRiA4b ORF-3 family protein, partial [Actinobacteria bacterium]|nr:plasmid pRiA4b ORF-3 family protein [Actinomycetota bacterium]